MAAAANRNRVSIAAAALLCQLLLASATPGTANFFQGIAILNPCTSATSPPGTMVYAARASDALWANGAACGRTYCVLCTGATDPSKPSPCAGQSSIYAMIQEQCSGCGATISLSQTGFNAIANPNVATTIKIEYAQVESASRFPCA